MVNQRSHKSLAWNPSSQEKSSQFAPRPFAEKAQQDSHRPATQEEIENQAFNQTKFVAFGLQLKEKSGTITPIEQERLGVLQAKMNDLWAQRLERTSRFGYPFDTIPIHAPGQHVSVPVQTSRAIQPYRADVPLQSSQPAIASTPNGEMNLVQRVFATRNFQHHPMPPIQPKLTLGKPNDRYEQEADRVAAEVVQRINAPSSTGKSVQREATPEEEEERHRTPLADSIQRVEIDDEEELQMKSLIDSIHQGDIYEDEVRQMTSQVERRTAIAVGGASTDLASGISSARGSGQPLDAGLQLSMGQAMGADFSGVTVHTDAQSDQLNKQIQAKAFTTGQDVFFRQGEYQPGSRGGQELIAHELTHVLQQNEGVLLGQHLADWGGSIQRKYSRSEEGDSGVLIDKENGARPVIKLAGYDADIEGIKDRVAKKFGFTPTKARVVSSNMDEWGAVRTAMAEAGVAGDYSQALLMERIEGVPLHKVATVEGFAKDSAAFVRKLGKDLGKMIAMDLMLRNNDRFDLTSFTDILQRTEDEIKAEDEYAWQGNQANILVNHLTGDANPIDTEFTSATDEMKYQQDVIQVLNQQVNQVVDAVINILASVNLITETNTETYRTTIAEGVNEGSEIIRRWGRKA